MKKILAVLGVLVVILMAFQYTGNAVGSSETTGKVTYAEKPITKDFIKSLMDRMGVRDPSKNYNVIVDGHGTGLAPPSEEDYKFLEKHAKYVEGVRGYRSKGSVDLSQTPYFPPVGDQAQQGSCAAWATSYYTNTYYQAKVHNWTDVKNNLHHVMSPAWTYNKANGGEDQGSSFLGNFYVMSTIGDASMATMPYSDADYKSWGTEDAWREAPIGRIPNVEMTDVTNIDVIKSWIDNGSLVNFAINADALGDKGNEAFADGNYIVSAQEYQNFAGQPNHGQTIVGYDDSITDDGDVGAFRVVNSWGGSWGDHGYYWITYNAFKLLAWNITYRIVGSTPNEPHIIGAWKFSSPGARDAQISVGVGDPNHPTDNRTLHLDGGNYSFPEFMAVDLTDYYSYWQNDNTTNFFVRFGDSPTGGPSSVVANFWLEYYPGAYVPGVPYRESWPSPDAPATTPGSLNNTLIPESDLSDLVVTPNDIDVPQVILIGSSVDISVTVHNDGVNASYNVTADVYVDRLTSFYHIGTMNLGDIAVGGSATGTVHWTPKPIVGEHKIIVVLDPDHMISELNESNNIAYKSVYTVNPPSAPYISAVRGDGYVNITWSEPSNGGLPIVKYSVYRNNVKIVDVDNTTLYYNDTSVSVNETYTYYVTASNDAGESDKSNEITVSWDVPGAPLNLTYEKGVLYVNLAWQPPAENGGTKILSYNVYRGTSPDSMQLIANVSANTTSYNDTDVSNMMTYYYYVTAVNAVGEGNASNTVNVTLNYDLEAPTLTIDKPKNGTTIYEKKVTVSWTGSDNVAIDHYEVKLDNGTWVNVGTDTSYVFGNLTVGHHVIYVKAVDTSNNSVVHYVEFTVGEQMAGLPPTIGGIPTIPLLSGLILLIIIIVIVAALMKKRGKSAGSSGEAKEETESSEETETSEEESEESIDIDSEKGEEEEI